MTPCPACGRLTETGVCGLPCVAVLRAVLRTWRRSQDRGRYRIWQRRHRATLKARGLCVQCGAERIGKDANFARCSRCRRLASVSQQKRRAA